VNVDSRLAHPVKDTLENEPGRLPSYSDTHAFTCEVCTWGALLVCSKAGRTGSSALDLPRASASAKDFLQTRRHNGFSLRYRGTSDRLLPPLPPETCTRALGSPLPDLGDFRHRGETGGADVSRRPSSLRPDSLTVHSGGLFVPRRRCDRASDTPVARPLLRAALSGDSEVFVRAEIACSASP